MTTIKTIEGDFTARPANYVIAVARFNSFIVDQLLEGALDALRRHGVNEEDITVVKVPGAFELPLTIQKTIDAISPDAVIALGAVIRGGTPHFDYVAGECASGLSRVSLESGVPVAFGVLTVDSIEQAIERAGTKAGNKGADAALGAMEMLSVIKKLTEE